MARMGFVSSRFAGTDGVTLESEKWAEVLRDFEHRSFWFAGKLDKREDESFLVPEAFFDHPDNTWINERIWGRLTRTRQVTRRIHQLAQRIKKKLYEFVKEFEIDILVVQNAMAIPMHVPLGIACTEFLAESGMPAIAHNHDFYWERSRFLVGAVQDYLDMAFPASMPNIQHVTINSAGRDELAWRKGLASTLIPNVLDFENPARYPKSCSIEARRHIGLAPGDIFILQPTRVVPRKGIEHAITVVSKLKQKRCKLVISHESGDEGDSYIEALREMAHDADVDLRLVHTQFGSGQISGGPADDDRFSLWDLYPCADLVTYPSLYEGFGNAFLEAVFFKRPLLVNRYATWIEDIEPKGFQAVLMDGYVTSEVVKQVEGLLKEPKRAAKMTQKNYDLAVRHYSYSVLSRLLNQLIANITGEDQSV